MHSLSLNHLSLTVIDFYHFKLEKDEKKVLKKNTLSPQVIFITAIACKLDFEINQNIKINLFCFS